MTQHRTTSSRAHGAFFADAARRPATRGSASVGHVALASAIALGGIASFTAFGGGLRAAIAGDASGASLAATALGDAPGQLPGGAGVTVSTEAAGLSALAHAANTFEDAKRSETALRAWAETAPPAVRQQALLDATEEVTRQFRRVIDGEAPLSDELIRGASGRIRRGGDPELKRLAVTAADRMDERALLLAKREAEVGNLDTAHIILGRFDAAVKNTERSRRRDWLTADGPNRRWYWETVAPRRTDVLEALAAHIKKQGLFAPASVHMPGDLALHDARNGRLTFEQWARVWAASSGGPDELRKFAMGEFIPVRSFGPGGVFGLSSLDKAERVPAILGALEHANVSKPWLRTQALSALLYAESIAITPELRGIGAAYARLGDRDAARAAFGRLIAHDPTNEITTGMAISTVRRHASHRIDFARELSAMDLGEDATRVLEAVTVDLLRVVRDPSRLPAGTQITPPSDLRAPFTEVVNAALDLNAYSEVKALLPPALSGWVDGLRAEHDAAKAATERAARLTPPAPPVVPLDAFQVRSVLEEFEAPRLLRSSRESAASR